MWNDCVIIETDDQIQYADLHKTSRCALILICI